MRGVEQLVVERGRLALRLLWVFLGLCWLFLLGRMRRVVELGERLGDA